MLDATTVNSFVQVALDTLYSTANKTAYRYADFERVFTPIKVVDGIICEIPFTGSLIGSLVIHFRAPAAALIYSQMMAEEVTMISPEVEEAFGEIANMISGAAKAAISEHKLNFGKTSAKAFPNATFTPDTKRITIKIPLAFNPTTEFDLYLGVA